MRNAIVIAVLISEFAFVWASEAQAAKSGQGAELTNNKKREQCCMQFGGTWDPSVTPGYCRKLRGTNAAITYNNCANGT